MLITPPEVSALLMQAQNPAPAIAPVLNEHKDIQTVIAVLKNQELFEIIDNNAQFRKGNAREDIPDENNRVKYLGFFLSEQLDPKRALKIKLDFKPSYAGTPLMLLLRSFTIVGKNQLRLVNGFSIQDYSEVDSNGSIRFEFEPLASFLKNPSKITGFNVFLIRPKEEKQPKQAIQVEPATQQAPPPSNKPKLNINSPMKRIDTKV